MVNHETSGTVSLLEKTVGGVEWDSDVVKNPM